MDTTQESTPTDIPVDVMQAPLPDWVLPVDHIKEKMKHGPTGKVYRVIEDYGMSRNYPTLKKGGLVVDLGADKKSLYLEEGFVYPVEIQLSGIHMYLEHVGWDARVLRESYISKWKGVYRIDSLTEAQEGRLLELHSEEDIKEELFEIRVRKERKELTEQQTTSLGVMGNSIRDAVSIHIADRKRRVEDEISRASEKLNELIASVNNLHNIEDKANNTFILADEISKVVEEGWYSYDSSPSPYIHKFITPEVTLVDDGQTLNMGRYLVKVMVDVEDLSIKVYVCEHTKNRVVEHGYIHPHVDSRGEVCWGNAAVAYSRASSSLELSKVLFLLRSVLTLYNRESPYKTLRTFSKVQPLGVNVDHGPRLKPEGYVYIDTANHPELRDEGNACTDVDISESVFISFSNDEDVRGDDITYLEEFRKYIRVVPFSEHLDPNVTGTKIYTYVILGDGSQVCIKEGEHAAQYTSSLYEYSHHVDEDENDDDYYEDED